MFFCFYRLIIFTEKDDTDEFVDARDVFDEDDESDVYDDNVQLSFDENTSFLDDDVVDEMEEKLYELGLMIGSTLASDYNGANAARLNANFL